ncbi:MAG: sigma-70 family RNA polymerase sigma factor [Bacteroidales bacterium]|nr:sigma-70 family RNA polymerase sigma factor [Candidatus Cacconaster merdequi]
MERTGEKRTDNRSASKAADVALVERAINEDQGAFASLMNKYRDPLLSHILKYVSIIEDAEDICQRSFEKAFMNISHYNRQFAFSTWLFNIAQNEAIDHLRRTRNSIASVSISSDNDVLKVMSGSTPEEDVIVDQAVGQLIDSISNLPEDYSVVARMRFIQDYSYEDIAQELDIPLGTVKTRINRARKMLLKVVDNPRDGKDS